MCSVFYMFQLIYKRMFEEGLGGFGISYQQNCPIKVKQELNDYIK
jgi:hypothetical protein